MTIEYSEKGLWKTTEDGKPLIIVLTPNAEQPSELPRAVPQLGILFQSLRYSHPFFRLWRERRKWGDGNCQETASQLMGELISKRMSEGWLYCEGEVEFSDGNRGYHAWLERDGWVVDLSNGRSWVMPRGDYEPWARATKVKRRTVQQLVNEYRVKPSRG